MDQPSESVSCQRTSTGKEDPVLAAAEKSELTCERTYSVHVELISGAEGARVRRRIAAITHELLGWAETRFHETSEKGKQP
ncbi:hypothetical protein [Amycolatopsis sp. cmx-4-83]|uniref:hypothetical protein n=1 Tax=Amycolatopsis sp. cmx-4-83 TaxID=2790940 RepID=UPI00397A714B